MALGWRHHALIQALLSRGPMTEESFHSLFAGISGKNPATHRQVFNETLLKINKALAYVQFELRACCNQYDGKVHYSVVNNVVDEQSKLGSKYSVPQIAFYKGVIEAIVQGAASQGCITSIDALNVCLESQLQDGQGSQDNQQRVPAAFKSFTMSQKEKTLNDLMKDQWLFYVADGKIGLGIRSFFDLRSWFRSNDIPSCEVCNEAGVKASICSREACNVRIHYYCLKKKFSVQKGTKACPRCGTGWPQADLDELDLTDATEQTQAHSSASQRTKRSTRVKAEAVEAVQPHGGTQSEATQVPVTRKRQAEAVEAVQSHGGTQSEAPQVPGKRKRLRSFKTEPEPEPAAIEDEASQLVAPPRVRTRRSHKD